jgi:hypothetical protein
MADNSDQYSSTASNGNGNRSGRKTNSRPHSRNEGRRDISAGNKNPSTGPATAADHDSPPGQNNQRRGSTQRAGNPTGRKPNDPASNQARRASDVGMSRPYCTFIYLLGCILMIVYETIQARHQEAITPSVVAFMPPKGACNREAKESLVSTKMPAPRAR